MATKIDVKRELGCYRATRDAPQLVTVPEQSFTDARDKTRWAWTLMAMVPDWITTAMFDEAVQQVAGKSCPTRLGDLRLEALCEGLCVQALHVGAYDDEAELLRRMHEEFVPDHGLTMVGKHHEIDLSDARRVEPAKLRTILRQPVAASAQGEPRAVLGADHAGDDDLRLHAARPDGRSSARQRAS